eukprot:TRINITY_DN11552_c2_g1_i1.p1 TRINITY_DN11552_c2_g1~~TRINITY_DN11552_c2_g1_i1.p1  ORF type:complete len:320 (-),score=75.54 TRINITY_DN11552_c2_g1_i1:44-949(-)
MVDISAWFHAAPWYYLLAVAAGGAIFIALVITITVVLVKRHRKNKNRRSPVLTELNDVVTQKTIVPSSAPVVISPVEPVTVNAQGQRIAQPKTYVPFTSSIPPRPITGMAPATLIAEPAPIYASTAPSSSSSSLAVPASSSSSKPSKSRRSWLGNGARKLPQPTTVAGAANIAHQSMQPLDIDAKRKLHAELLDAEMEERERQLNEQLSDEEDAMSDDPSDSSSWEEEVYDPRPTLKQPVPVSFGPYSARHHTAACSIQRCYRAYMVRVEREVQNMLCEMGNLMVKQPSTTTAPQRMPVSA